MRGVQGFREGPEYLQATAAIEAAHPSIRAKALELVGDADAPREKVRRLSSFVRDRVPYNLFMSSMHPDDFRASFVAEFDGRNDAMPPARALDGGPCIEYLEHLGQLADLPLEFITARTSKVWGRDQRAWLRPEDDTGFP